MNRTGEGAFETVIESHLLGNGYVSVPGHGFDRERAVFPETALGFIRETQPEEWSRLEALLGERTGEQVLADLCRWMDRNGALATLRHGFKCYGRTLRIAFFKAAHALNPELEARYAANRVGLTRQLRFSPRSEQSLDLTLSLNGIPVSTLELKNPLTGQGVEDARGQYRQDRDPREPIFEFKRRTLVHFAVDTESVLMTTRLAGAATHFLPFDKGCGAGNPPDPRGRGYRTSYLWEEVLARDSLLDLLARFVHLRTGEKRDDKGRKVKVETMIFPRYHQLEAVRRLVDAARREGAGHNALVEHSAGSGKSNTIAWLAHRFNGATGGLGANPVEAIIHTAGEWTLRLLPATLAGTPFRHLSGRVWLTWLRRMVGLFAFFYLVLHFSTCAVLDTSLDLVHVIEDVVDRLYITVVFAAFVMLVPLGATSTNAMVRRLVPLRLRRLHRLVYAGILTVLLAARLPVVGKWMQASRPRSVGRCAAAA